MIFDDRKELIKNANELIELYNKYIYMFAEDVILYESEHGDDKGHENIYKGEVELISRISCFEKYFKQKAGK